MPERIDLTIGTATAASQLDALIAKAKQLTEELRKAATVLGSNPTQSCAAQIFNLGTQLHGVNAAINGIQNSASTGGAAGAGNAGTTGGTAGTGMPLPGAAGVGGGGGSVGPIGVNPSTMGGARPASPAVTPFPPLPPMFGPSSAQTTGAITLIAATAGTMANSQLEYNTERIRRGGYDAMGQAAIYGRAAGTLIGGAIGLLGGGWTAVAGAVGGGQFGENVMRYLLAPTQNRLEQIQSLNILGVESNTAPNVGGYGNSSRRAIRVGRSSTR